MNPFEEIENKLDRIEKLIQTNNNQKQYKAKARYVHIGEFSNYSGMSVHTIYAKLCKRGQGIRGAFKSGPKTWLFDLDEYDKYLEEKKNEQLN